MFATKRLAWALVLSLLLPSVHGKTLPPEPKTAAEMAAAADPNDPVIAQIAADRIQQWNYSQHPFDGEMSSKFLDNYLDTLDYFHMFFIKSDIDEFEKYRTNLNVLTLKEHDITPCWVIFARFMERVHQRIDLASNLLETAKFDFSAHEKFVLNRHKLPYAKDLDEAKDFWTQELRAEYLDQLLTSPDVQYTGPVSFDAKSNIVVSLKRDRLHPGTLEYLPMTFMAKDGHEIGSVEIAANQSNATVRLSLDLPSRESLKKTTNHLYSAKGEELGDVTFRHEKAETNDLQAAQPVASSAAPADQRVHAPPGTDSTKPLVTAFNETQLVHVPPSDGSNNLVALIHLDRKNLADIHKTLTNRYTQMLGNYKALEMDRTFELYVNSLARAYDPHSDFMGRMTAENFNIQMKLSLFGIGALLGKDNDYCKIIELKEGPAKRSGKINENDRIVAVAQSNAEPVDVEGMTLDKIVELIRGPKGTQVTLTVLPADQAASGERRDVTLMRDEIKLEDQEVKSRLYENTNTVGSSSRLGVITIPSFYADNGPAAEHSTNGPKSMTGDVARLIKRMKQEKVGGLILDLRHNGGGYLEEAIKLTGLFVRPGPVVQTKDPTGETVTDGSRLPPIYDGPLVVLTSRFSASASEILAGALQDYNRALIVGDHATFGKGTVQTMQDLQPYLIHYQRQNHLKFDTNYDPGSLKITIKKFYRAGGASTQLKGVLSDIELPSILNYEAAEVGESALPNALSWDEVTSSNPENLDRVRPFLPELLQRSHQRVAASKDFAYIQEDIAEFLKLQADKSLSLNLTDRKAEQKIKTARTEAIKKERMSRPKSDEKVFEITLKNVDLAQLQPPSVKTNSVTVIDASFDDEADPDEAAAAAEAVIDPVLEEAKHILADYIALWNKEPFISKAP